MKYKIEGTNKSRIKMVLIISGALVAAISLLKYASGFYAIISSDGKTDMPTAYEAFFESLFSALRAFGVTENYTDWTIEIRNMVSGIIPQETLYFDFVKGLIVGYATLLNIAAPVVGGAVILQIFASVFPKLELKFIALTPKREKCYFSELNAESLALAKSICEHHVLNKKTRPIFIFADTYIDDENEKEYELLLEAKRLGAICVRDDILHIPKCRRGQRKYYLMDIDEFVNLQHLVGLTKGKNLKSIKKSEIYILVKSDAYVQVESKIVDKLCPRDKSEKIFKTEEMPRIVPVNADRNLINNLFADVPLYEPLVGRKDVDGLTLTIMGNGMIGTEAFLTAYWLGQIMVSGKGVQGKIEECPLAINVVSKDSENDFWSKIDYVNPEIKQTIRIYDGKDDDGNDKIIPASKELLCYNDSLEPNSYYCTVNYMQADVKFGSFWNTDDKKDLLDSDYFIIALGNDADNISVAEKLRNMVGEKHLLSDTNKNTVISYVVFNSELCKVLNQKITKTDKEKTPQNIYMHAFGSLDQVYSNDNLFMEKSQVIAKGIGDTYNKTLEKSFASNHLQRAGDDNKNYSYWADIARALHIKYKLFSLGWITKSIFTVQDEDSYHNAMKELYAQYKRIAGIDLSQTLNKDDEAKREDIKKKMEQLAWLEHRRWCAFTRTLGYRFTDAIEKNFEATGSYKNMSLKLHPCLVEARCPENAGMKYMCDKKSDEDSNKELDSSVEFDYLDKMSHKWMSVVKEAKKSSSDDLKKKATDAYCYDFKTYDYYRHDVEELKLKSEFLTWNRYKKDESGNLVLRTRELIPELNEEQINRFCKRGKKYSIEKYSITENDDNHIIPVSTLRNFIMKYYVELTKDDKNLKDWCKAGTIDNSFEFAEKWYVKKSDYMVLKKKLKREVEK